MPIFSPFCINKLIAQLKVIFTPVFTAHSSPLPFIRSVNIGTTNERGDDPNTAAARESCGGIPLSFAQLWSMAGKEAQAQMPPKLQPESVTWCL